MQKSYKAIAEIVGCSPSMVSRVMKNERNAETKLGKKIKHAHELYESNLRKQREIERKNKIAITRKIEKQGEAK